LLDQFPTLCELCDVSPASGLEGRSLVPYLVEPQSESMKPALSQFPQPWFYRDTPEVMGYAVRMDTHRYVEWRNFDSGAVTARELYDDRAGEPGRSGCVA
jgi:iduronate 2-sulfatase